jgi:hypothetical protein
MFTEKVTKTDCFIKVFPKYHGNSHDVGAAAEFLDRAEPRSDAQPIIIFGQGALEPENVVENAREICHLVGEIVSGGMRKHVRMRSSAFTRRYA